jgi:homoserine dehydrogenase
MPAPFRIGLIGLGHVGGALARRLTDDHERIARAAGRPIALEMIGVRKPESRLGPAPLVEADAVPSAPGLNAVVELIGGIEPARGYINSALTAGRQVITANKQLIARHGPELARLGPLHFEASVGSAIPIIETLAETLAADEIHGLAGILNGTTNFMLGLMAKATAYDEALREAQRLGMAEADPSADVDGHDAAAKLAILIMLAFRARIDVDTIERIGIRPNGAADVQGTGWSGYGPGQVIKLIAAARREGAQVFADVRPRPVRADSFFAQADGALNAITVEARYAGTMTLAGPGAGPDAAASAVISDLIRAAGEKPASAANVLGALADQPALAAGALGAEGIQIAGIGL